MPLIDRIVAWQVPPRWILIAVETDDGLTGWGEAIAPKRARAVLGAIDDIADNLRGSSCDRIEEAATRMRNGGFFRGGPILSTAAAAIEQALWDIKARRLGVPVYELLGGAVRESTRTYAWIGGDRPADVADHARRRMEQGYTAVKMNATAESDHLGAGAVVDGVIERIGSVRDAVGAALDIALDFHGRVHRSVVPALLHELIPFKPIWVEEPLSPGHDDSLRELVPKGCPIPIATGERLVSRWEFKRLLEERVVDVIQPDVSLTGVFEMRKIAAMAEAYDVAVAPHCPNGPVSLAATLQVAACTPNIAMVEHSVGIHYHRGHSGLGVAEPGDYLSDSSPIDQVNGYLPRSDSPGLGIEIDRAIVEERSHAWSVRDPEWRHPDGRIAEW